MMGFSLFQDGLDRMQPFEIAGGGQGSGECTRGGVHAPKKSARWALSTLTVMALATLLLPGCVQEAAIKGTDLPPAPVSADQLLVVDCLLPGQIRRLGTQTTYVSARRPIQTTAQDCEIRGGEYVLYDRATYQSALRIWMPLALDGDADAQNRVGEIYARGLGARPDYEQAALWYRRAAQQGLERAQINLGFLYEKGLGVEQDNQRALDWYRKASALPDAVAMDPADAEGQSILIASLAQELESSRAELDRVREERDRLGDRLRAEQADLISRPDAAMAASPDAAEQRQIEDESQRALEQQLVELAQRQERIDQLQSVTRQQQERLLLLETEGTALRQQLALVHDQFRRSQQDLERYQAAASENEKQVLQGRADLAALASTQTAAAAARVGELEAQLRDREQLLAQQRETLERLRVQSDQWREKIAQLELRQHGGTVAAQSADADLPVVPPAIQLIEPPLLALRGAGEPRIPVSRGLQQRTLVGQVQAPAGLFALTVNGVRTSTDARGLFEVEVPVPGPETTVHIVAIDTRGQRGELELSLVSEQQTASAEAARRTNPLKDVEIGTYHALVIGNQRYAHLPSLDTSGNDARVVADLLGSRFGYRVTLLIDANRYQILSEMNRLRQELTDRDNLLIYYAGHGELDRVNLRGHWLPVDAEMFSSANWISNTSITDILNAMSVRQVLVVADSCYSGALTRSSLAQLDAGQSEEAQAHWLRTLATMRSRTALTSGGLAPVLDGGGGDHSVFAKSFISVLQEMVEVTEGQRVFRELSARVAFDANRYRVEQVPEYAPIKYSGHEAGDFLFIPKVALN